MEEIILSFLLIEHSHLLRNTQSINKRGATLLLICNYRMVYSRQINSYFVQAESKTIEDGKYTTFIYNLCCEPIKPALNFHANLNLFSTRQDQWAGNPPLPSSIFFKAENALFLLFKKILKVGRSIFFLCSQVCRKEGKERGRRRGREGGGMSSPIPLFAFLRC